MIEDRVKAILADLEAVRENLLALSDDIWLNIDHNNTDALDKGVTFKRAYNERMQALDVAAGSLSALIQQYTQVPVEEPAGGGPTEGEENRRIVKELDRQTPHSIDEDFEYKRPYGSVLRGGAYVDVVTWRRLYELLCRQLAEHYPDCFATLPDDRAFVSVRGNRAFARTPGKLRKAALVAEGVYAEINESANRFRDSMRRLLAAFGIPVHELRIYLREDRDA